MKQLVEKLPTFIGAPQSRVWRDYVFIVARVHGIHIYDVPVVGSEGSRQKGEAQQAADAGCDHQRAEGYLHPVQVRAELARNGDGVGFLLF